jgi:hypothetical protein
MSARVALGVVLAIGGGAAALIALQPPGWIVVLLGSVVFAGIYIVARLNSRYDPLDPRFGSCIPPIQRHKAIDEE